MYLPGGDFSSVDEFYVQNGQDRMLTIFGPAHIMWTFAFGLVIALVFSQPANQPLLQTCMAAKDEKTIIRALWIAAPVNGMFGVFICVIGLTAKSLPEFQAYGPKLAATTMLVEVLPSWLVVVLIGAFMSAILSSFAMTALAPATIFSNDVYKRFYNPEASEEQMTRVTRLAIIVLAMMAIMVGSSLPTILASVGWVLAWLMPVLWLIVSGLFWKRSSVGAGITLATVWSVNFLWSFTHLPAWLQLTEIPNSYVMLVLTVIVGSITNWIFPGRPQYMGSDQYRAHTANAV